MRFRGLVLSMATIAGGCGLGVTGTLEVGTDVDGGSIVTTSDAASPVSTDASSTPDAPVTPPVDAGPCSTTGTACTSALAAGWTPIAFASNRTAACPAGWAQADLVTAPTAAAGACACACQIDAANPPTCAKGSVTTQVGSTNACGSTGMTYTFNGTGCTALAGSGSIAAYGKGTPLALTPGTCTPSVTKDATKLGSTAVRACTPTAECTEDLCAGPGPSPFGSCIAHDGDVACPAGPFASKALVGSTASLTCGGCATCQNSGTCGPAKMHWYNDMACATELGSRSVDGACNALASGSSSVTVSYVKYDVAVQNAACTPTGTATTTASLDTARTICCR